MFGTLSMVRGLELIMVTQELFGVSTVTVSFNKLHLWCLFETECLNISVQDVHSGAICCFFNMSTLRGH